MHVLCRSHHAIYVCILGRATMSGGDGTDSSTRVHAVMCVWAPVATSCCARCYVLPLLKAPVLVMSIRYRKAPGLLTKHPGLALGRGGRQDRQTGGEILSAHVYRKQDE
jgi:hypothetical protein